MMILLLIDEKKTEDQGRIVCNTLTGDLSLTKNGYISGVMKKANVVCIEDDLKDIKLEFAVIDSGTIVINYFELEKCINASNVLLGYKNNRRISVIQDSLEIGMKNISVEKNKIYITTKYDVSRIDEKHHIIPCAAKTLFIKNNCIIIANSLIDKKLLKTVIFSKRPKEEISKGELFKISNALSSFEICKDIKIAVSITESKREFYLFPVILYNGVKAVGYNLESVVVDNKYYYKDYISEEKVRKYFSRYEMVSPNIYKVSASQLYSSVKGMLQQGFEVFIEKKPVLVDDTSFNNVRIESGIEWLEIDGNIEFDDDSIAIADFIGNNINYIELKDKVVLVPDNISKIFKMADKNGKIEKTPENYLRIIELSKSYFDVAGIKELYNEDLPLKVSDELIQTLFEYQFDGVLWMKRLAMHGYGGCLADDMGLGKTLQIISFLSDTDISSKYRKVIIIVPKTLLGNWIKEFEKYDDTGKRIIMYYGSDRNLNSDFDICITTYGIVMSDFEQLNEQLFDMIILDEAQKVKNPSSKIRKIIKKFSNKRVLFAATGTPYENNLLELWSIIDLTNSGILDSEKNFLNKYVSEDDKSIDYLAEMLTPFLLRRKKEDVLSGLPEKKQEEIICIMDSKQRQLYNAMLIKIKRDLKKTKEPGIKKLQMLNGLTFLREICCHPQLIEDGKYKQCEESIKKDIIMDLVKEADSNGEKIVIYSQFTKFLKIIENGLENEKIQYCYIDGQTIERERQVELFYNEGKCVLLISLKAGGFGLNLTNANKMIICDPWWNPAVERQAEDRIYRIGQKEDVIVYRLIAKDTIEEKMQALKEKKDEIGNLIYDGMKDISELDDQSLIEFFK